MAEAATPRLSCRGCCAVGFEAMAAAAAAAARAGDSCEEGFEALPPCSGCREGLDPMSLLGPCSATPFGILSVEPRGVAEDLFGAAEAPWLCTIPPPKRGIFEPAGLPFATRPPFAVAAPRCEEALAMAAVAGAAFTAAAAAVEVTKLPAAALEATVLPPAVAPVDGDAPVAAALEAVKLPPSAAPVAAAAADTLDAAVPLNTAAPVLYSRLRRPSSFSSELTWACSV